MPVRPMPLQTGIVYGPLHSRRFGASLGINLLATDQKLCNFNCPYCQYGDSHLEGPAVMPTAEEIDSEVSSVLRTFESDPSKINSITIAGNGEPTLHLEFPQIVDRLIALRDRSLPGVPIGILSNSSTCHRPHIREALSRLDARFMKLDAGSSWKFRSVNKPAEGVRWEEMIGGLCRLENTVLQSMFFAGHMQNISQDIVQDWIGTVKMIQPRSVQIYSLDRPPADARILPASPGVLRKISEELTERTGISSAVF